MEKNENLHAGHYKRLRDKAINQDITRLSEREVLELTLQLCFNRGDLNDLSARLLKRFKSYYGVLSASKEELLSVDGIGESAAEKLMMLPKLVNFYDISKSKQKEVFAFCVKDCIDIAFDYLKNLEQERLYMFVLNNSGKLIKEIVLGEGQETCVKIKTNEIILKAMENKAGKVFFAHNHPSGQAKPSMSDINFTKQITKALFFAGVQVVDHIIVAKDEAFSFSNHNMI